MKNKLYIILTISILGVFACSKEVANTDDYQPYSPAKDDANAGDWKTIVLAKADEIAVPQPESNTSAAYLKEVADVLTGMSGNDAARKKVIAYWSVGGAIRWNQIMRELVAKHNLPPKPNADNTYPIPNSANPFSYPEFPFSNPPYAARAYAYVSVAQYDAMVAANYYKRLYNRSAPYNVDVKIVPLVEKSSTGSYPCEDAVMAGALIDIMKFMFPTETAYIDSKAAEQKQYKMWAGAATLSDITAGEALGKAISAKVLAKAKSDGMKNAIGNQYLWDSLANRKTTIGGELWKSLETPARPPMLPFYGSVKTWLFDKSTMVNSIIPGAPLDMNTAEFKAQLAEVKSEVTGGNREHLRIAHFWADGAGTYTPPGHWNFIACEKMYANKMSDVRCARNLALLNIAMMDAGISCWFTKTLYYFPRPTQVDPSIKTLTGMPNFPSYMSGHSSFSGVASTILGHIFPSNNAEFAGQAEEASLSRLYGGIHYKMDCDAGISTGNKIGKLAIEKAKKDGAE